MGQKTLYPGKTNFHRLRLKRTRPIFSTHFSKTPTDFPQNMARFLQKMPQSRFYFKICRAFIFKIRKHLEFIFSKISPNSNRRFSDFGGKRFRRKYFGEKFSLNQNARSDCNGIKKRDHFIIAQNHATVGKRSPDAFFPIGSVNVNMTTETVATDSIASRSGINSRLQSLQSQNPRRDVKPFVAIGHFPKRFSDGPAPPKYLAPRRILSNFFDNAMPTARRSQ